MRKEYDFSNAKRAKDVPHLSKLQSEVKDKTCVVIMLDNEVLQSFLINQTIVSPTYECLIENKLV